MKFYLFLVASLLPLLKYAHAQESLSQQEIQQEWITAGLQHSLEKGMLRYASTHNIEDIPLHLKPSIMRQKTSLARFHLAYHQLAQLPKNTKQLTLKQKSFDSVPKVIGSFSQLESLSLAQNQLWHIPLELQNLTLLKTLDLSDNFIEQLPDYFSQLTALQTVNLYHNKLSYFTTNVFEKENLQSLNLAHNQLKSIPDDIHTLKNLKVLNLSWNKLTRLPDSILLLPSLEELHLEGNPELILSETLMQRLEEKLKFFYFDIPSYRTNQ